MATSAPRETASSAGLLADRLARAAATGPSALGGEIRDLFDAVSPRYDLLNRLLSLGLDHGWRRRAARACVFGPAGRALDVCTGTGDLALLLRRAVGPGGVVVGADLSVGMLRHGRKKGARSALVADALELPFPDGSFDAATIAFGIRNVSDPGKAIGEMARVVRVGGRVVVLEFSAPRSGPIRFVHGLWLRLAVPLIGRVVSGRGEAYRYLSRSVESFTSRVDLASVFRGAGLAVVDRRPLTLGAVEMLVGLKTS